MTTSAIKSLYEEYIKEMQTIADLRYAAGVLQWDQETYLPPKGAPIRGQQIATLSEIAHKYFTDEKLGARLQELLAGDKLSAGEKRNVELTWQDYSKQKKFHSSFVRTLAEAVNKSFHSWMEARKANDFSLFANDLARLIELKKQEADMLGYEHHPYNALLDDHDKGATVQLLDGVFSAIQQPLKELLGKIAAQPPADDSFLHQHFDKDKQWQFGLQVVKELGYDMEAGRQDISEHPFTTNFNSQDVRITTRIDENDLSNMVWSCIHEAGHALYEQGLPLSEYGLPLGEPASYTIHESQSRLWENHVGRSRAFCERWLPILQQYFPEQLGNISVEQFYKGINKVQPSLIRTEADELTYHFHIKIRYELEKLLIGGTMNVNDIPGYWNEQYLQLMGVKVPGDKQGCLQDVHWSHGSFGYFPTYSLGSFYAAQFYHYANQSITNLNEHIKQGNTTSLLQWLRSTVHQKGRRFTSEELCKDICGETLNIEYFTGYLLDKYKDIYKF
ncbi:carboxypeptidase M32 [Niastella sp. OAS944]|uniref:carboxypeptidase M32 n=1 Tax=Niastella sp. OAS944 TaxID=2664089 RepID=UPI00347C8FDE|nr:carboxypeptidase Taq [Chitinophagaceae bacterium OAS944]